LTNLTPYTSPDQIYADFVGKLNQSQSRHLNNALIRSFGDRVSEMDNEKRDRVRGYLKDCLVKAIREGVSIKSLTTETAFNQLIKSGERAIKQERNGLLDLVKKLPSLRDLYGALDETTKFGEPIKALLEKEAKDYITDFPEYRKISRYLEASKKFIDLMIDKASESTRSPISFNIVDSFTQNNNLAKAFRNVIVWSLANSFGQKINPFVVSDIELTNLLTAMESVVPDLDSPNAVDGVANIFTKRMGVFIEEEDTPYVNELIWRQSKIIVDFFQLFKNRGFIVNLYTTPFLFEVARISSDIAIYPDHKKDAKLNIWRNGLILPNGETIPDPESIDQCLQVLRQTNQLIAAERARLIAIRDLVRPIKSLNKELQDILAFEKTPPYISFIENYGDPEVVNESFQIAKGEYIKASFLQKVLELGLEPNPYLLSQYTNLASIGIEEGKTLNSEADYLFLDMKQKTTVWEIIKENYVGVNRALTSDVVISFYPKRELPHALRMLIDRLPVKKVKLAISPEFVISGLESLKERAERVLTEIQDPKYKDDLIKDPYTRLSYNAALEREYSKKNRKSLPPELEDIGRYVEKSIEDAEISLRNGIIDLKAVIFDLTAISNFSTLKGITSVVDAEKRLGYPDSYKLTRLFGSIPYYSVETLRTVARIILDNIESSALDKYSQIDSLKDKDFYLLLGYVLEEYTYLNKSPYFVRTGKSSIQLGRFLALAIDVVTEFNDRNNSTLLTKKAEFERLEKILNQNSEIYNHLKRKKKIMKKISDRVKGLRDLDAILKPE